MEENYDIFDEYVMKYDMNERMIAYKFNHSYRVEHQAEEICRSINTDTVERDLASFIALVHDIARFRQWTEYKTFDDAKSFDHGDEGANILFKEGMINEFNVNKDDYDIIKKAVRNHNKFNIEDNLNDRELLHAKIVRDADKIDILYSFSTNILLEIEEDENEGISDEVRENFLNHNLVKKENVKNKNDRILMLLSLIYDINYDYSIERIKNEKYVEKFYEHIKNKKMFKEYFEEMKKYLKEVKHEQ